MRKHIIQYLTLISLLCIAGSVAGSPQDQPEVKKKVEPWYPAILKKAGIEGQVWLKVLVDENGFVAKAETVKSTHPAFAASAIAAVKQWEFSPAMKDGKPIKAEVTIPFRFKLADGPPQSKHEGLIKLQKDIVRFLRGGAAEDVQSHLGASAFAVVGNTSGPLASYFSDKAKKTLLTEGAETLIEWTHSVVSDAGDMASLVLKTNPAEGKTERYHTVVFVKSPDGKWSISSWHAGK